MKKLKKKKKLKLFSAPTSSIYFNTSFSAEFTKTLRVFNTEKYKY